MLFRSNSLGNNEYTLSSTVTSPIVSTDKNVSWNFWLNGMNTTSFNQTIMNAILDDCSTYTNKIINYTLLDENTQSLINNANSTIETEIKLETSTGDLVTNYSNNFKGKSSPQICSNVNLTSLYLWETSRYGSDNYVFKAHHIQNASISEKQDIPLYDLKSADATTFKISYKSAEYLPVTDAIINIQRRYIGEATYKSVESPVTDRNGEASGSFDLNAVNYQITVSKSEIGRAHV